MKILVDLQGCQTESRHRGIGRYSLALAKAVVRNRGAHHVVLLANGAFSSELLQLKSEFSGLIEDNDFVVFPVPSAVAEINPVNFVNCRQAELIRERLIADIAPDVVLLTSLFEGFLDDAVTSIGTIGERPLSGAVLYDLIPYLRRDPAWPEEYLKHYAGKIESLKRADFLLSISDYARQEASGAIPELSDRIFNISSACDSTFCPSDVSASRRQALCQRYGIKGKFVMSAGNVEPRKNFEAVLQAFATLPDELRAERQVVIVGSANDARVIENLEQIVVRSGMNREDLIITGHASDEDLLDLYRLCEIFIFASLHEGFGLPPLEAMACGAPTLGSKATSVPEVIGDSEAMFDPESVDELRGKLLRALTDPLYFQRLKSNALLRAAEFSWDKTAAAAIGEMEQRFSSFVGRRNGIVSPPEKLPALAMVSPLPPEQTGIADYLAELLPELSRYYKVTVISDQMEVAPGPSGEKFEVRSIEWFEAHADSFDRIVYQMGNSPFHAHMSDLMQRYPGVVVLHDFFLSALAAWTEVTGYEKDGFRRNLMHSHGYPALSLLEMAGLEAAKLKWPCSFEVINSALGLILHSNHSRDLICQYYGKQFAAKAVIAKQHRLLPVKKESRDEVRDRLGITEDCFLVCSFGFMDKTKLNHRLLEAWIASSLAQDKQCRLVFVGGKEQADYGIQLDRLIERIDGGKRISITGFASRKTFEDYLTAADAAVQLRTLSRGETSRTVLDCLAYGLPVIVNAHGSMAEYPEDIVIKLADEFDQSELVDVLERLHADSRMRDSRSKDGVEYIRSMHSPEQTVKAYVEAIEGVANNVESQLLAAATRRFWASIPLLKRHERSLLEQKVAFVLGADRRPTLYVDISATSRNDLRTGIERVARAFMQELLNKPPEGYLVKPVYLDQCKEQWVVRVANRFLSKQQGFSLIEEDDDVVTPRPEDVLMALDLFVDGVVGAEKQGLYSSWRSLGAKVGFLVFDILPITHPHCFPDWAKGMHENWLNSVVRSSNILVCISKHVRSEVEKWMDSHFVPISHRPVLEVSYLGADVEASFPTMGFPDGSDDVLRRMENCSNFLMVGTIEPRKCHLDVISAFKKLWRKGVKANLIIVGHEGWKGLPDAERRTIPETISAIRKSEEFGRKLIWLEGISDEYLSEVYKKSNALIAASEDEGFGLPLIEAFREGVFVIARDIPVFREIGGTNVDYFSSLEGDRLDDHVMRFIEHGPVFSKAEGGMCLSWAESAEVLKSVITK